MAFYKKKKKHLFKDYYANTCTQNDLPKTFWIYKCIFVSKTKYFSLHINTHCTKTLYWNLKDMHIKFLSTYWRKMLVVLVKTISQSTSAKIWQSPESTKWKEIPCFILTKALFIKKIFVIKMISEWDKERNMADCLDLQAFITNLHKWIQVEHKGQINNWTPERSDLCFDICQFYL